MGKLFWSRGLTAPAKVFAFAGAVCLAWQAQANTNLYTTYFETSEGYNAQRELWGQKDWTGYSLSDRGGNGLIDYLGTQAGYVGLFALEPAADYLAVYQPIQYSPIQSGNPVVRFSVKMSIVDSYTVTNRDDFRWEVYNRLGKFLFGLSFYNPDLNTYYSLDGTNYTPAGVEFMNETNYTLKVTMDFAQNKWYAQLNSTTLATNLPISSYGARLDLGDVDAVWAAQQGATAVLGDNYMIFDNYQVSAYIAPSSPPTLTSLGLNANRQFRLKVEGALDTRYAIDATTNLVNWTALRTNATTDGAFEFTDTGSTSFTRRYYRARLVK